MSEVQQENVEHDIECNYGQRQRQWRKDSDKRWLRVSFIYSLQLDRIYSPVDTGRNTNPMKTYFPLASLAAALVVKCFLTDHGSNYCEIEIQTPHPSCTATSEGIQRKKHI